MDQGLVNGYAFNEEVQLDGGTSQTYILGQEGAEHKQFFLAIEGNHAPNGNYVWTVSVTDFGADMWRGNVDMSDMAEYFMDLGRAPSPLSQIYEWIEGALHGGAGQLVVVPGGSGVHVEAAYQPQGQRTLRVRLPPYEELHRVAESGAVKRNHYGIAKRLLVMQRKLEAALAAAEQEQQKAHKLLQDRLQQQAQLLMEQQEELSEYRAQANLHSRSDARRESKRDREKLAHMAGGGVSGSMAVAGMQVAAGEPAAVAAPQLKTGSSTAVGAGAGAVLVAPHPTSVSLTQGSAAAAPSAAGAVIPNAAAVAAPTSAPAPLPATSAQPLLGFARVISARRTVSQPGESQVPASPSAGPPASTSQLQDTPQANARLAGSGPGAHVVSVGPDAGAQLAVAVKEEVMSQSQPAGVVQPAVPHLSPDHGLHMPQPKHELKHDVKAEPGAGVIEAGLQAACDDEDGEGVVVPHMPVRGRGSRGRGVLRQVRGRR